MCTTYICGASVRKITRSRRNVKIADMATSESDTILKEINDKLGPDSDSSYDDSTRARGLRRRGA